jgi:hypothetical protein
VTAPLAVDTAALRRAGAAFVADAGRLAAVDAESPLRSAAAAVDGLTTAGACHAAAATVHATLASTAEATRGYAVRLSRAADAYDSTDQSAGHAIAGVAVPEPGR